MKNKIILLSVLFCAILLRLHNLGKIPFWEDELWSLYRSNSSLADTLTNAAILPTHPPFFYLLLNPWLKLAGVNEWTLRFPGVVFSVLSVFMIFKLGEVFYNRRTGLYAALLLAVSPFDIYYAQEARNYSLSWMLGALSFWLFYRLAKRFRTADCFAYLSITIIAWYTSYTAVVYSLIQIAGFFIFLKPREAIKWIAPYLFIVILYLPWLKIIATQHLSWDCLQWIPATHNYFSQITWLTGQLLYAFPASGKVSPESLFACAILIAAAVLKLKKIGVDKVEIAPAVGKYFHARPYHKKTRQVEPALDIKKEDILLIIWIILPFIIYYLVDKFWFRLFSVQRYFGLVLIPLLLLLSKGINKFRPRLQLAIIYLIICYLFILTLRPYYTAVKKTCDERWGDALKIIKKELSPNSNLVVIPFPPVLLNYYKSGLPLLLKEDYRGLTYEGNKFGSIFVISRTRKKMPVTLPKYILHKEWPEGKLKVQWYKDKRREN